MMNLADVEYLLKEYRRSLFQLMDGKPAGWSWRKYKLHLQADLNGLRHLKAQVNKGVRVDEGCGNYSVVHVSEVSQ